LNDEKLKDVKFEQISENLEEFYIDKNEKIENYLFLNVILTRCRKLKKISMKGMRIKESAKYIDFSLAGPDFSQVNFDTVDDIDIIEGTEPSVNYFTFEFKDWLMKRSSSVFGIYDFEREFVHKFLEEDDLNYFDIFE
jgi:hypothetical protein